MPHLEHLPLVSDVADLQLTVEKCSRADQMFMKKNMYAIMSMIYKGVTSTAGITQQANFDALLCTMCLLCVEVGFDEVSERERETV